MIHPMEVEKTVMIINGIIVVLVSNQNKSKCTNPNIMDCMLLPIWKPSLWMSCFARKPRKNISSDKDVLINAIMRMDRIHGTLNPANLNFPVTLFGESMACLIPSSINAKPIMELTESNETIITIAIDFFVGCVKPRYLKKVTLLSFRNKKKIKGIKVKAIT